MSHTYSTRNREMAAGSLYSTRGVAPPAPPPTRHTAPPPPSQPGAAAAVPIAPLRRFSFALSPVGLPVSAAMPGATGRVEVAGVAGGPCQVTGEITGLPPAPDPAVQPTLWLIHDLTVPVDLAPADQALLPRGLSNTGNQPGTVFTFDGNPPSYGPHFNTLSVAVSPGRFTRVDGNNWRLLGSLDATTNVAFHPLFFAGPSALADINTPVYSGSLARVLTDLFMRPATVNPELPLGSHYLARLKAASDRHLGPGVPGTLLDSPAFTRAAVTFEAPIRTTPALMPTREGCILLGANREES